MKPTLLVIAITLATLAGCDRKPASPQTSGSAASGSSSAAQSNTPTTPANTGAPSDAEKKQGAQPPVQGQVDAKQNEQRKDFQHKGDGAGPKQ